MTTLGAHSGLDRIGSAPLGPEIRYFGFEAWDPEPYLAAAEPNGFRIADKEELPTAHQVAESIMGMRLAPVAAVASAHAKTKATVWVHDRVIGEGNASGLSGIILLLPLSWDGEAALRTGCFNFSAPQARQLCAPDDEIASLYLWLCAGGDRVSRRAIMRTAQAWFDGPSSTLRVYGRAASEEGLRAFANFGFQRLSPIRSDVFFLDRRR